MGNGGTPAILPCAKRAEFKLTPQALESAITPATRWFVLNSPSIPAGTVFTAEEPKALSDVLLRHPHVLVLCDEIYNRIWYANLGARSIFSVMPRLASRALVVNSVSKSYALTGWRIGYGAGPKELINAINKLQSQSSSCPISISQAAAALTGNQTSTFRSVKVDREGCERAWQRLNAIDGLSCVKPASAFYLFPYWSGVIGKTTPDGKKIECYLDFAIYLLENAGIATIHSAAYGMKP